MGASLVQMHCPSSLASLKSSSCLSKTAQTWREKPANSSDMTRFSGKSFRLGEKIRLHGSVHDTTSRSKATSRKTRLKSAKNLYLSHRFFDEIRQIHRFFAVIRQILQILCRNQARQPIGAAGLQAHWASWAHLVRNPARQQCCLAASRPICPAASRVSRADLEKCDLQASCGY